MDEKALTQAAILKAQALNKEQTKRDNKLKDEVKEVLKTAKTAKTAEVAEVTKTEVTEDNPEFPFSVQLGNTKTVHFKTWTGKTKKQLNKLVGEDISEISLFENLIKILVQDHIAEPEMYLSEIEQQYLVMCIKAESLTEDFEFEGQCSICSNYKVIQSKIKESITYTKNSYPASFKKFNLEFVDISLTKTLQNTAETYINSEEYDGITTETDIEIAMHISKDGLTSIEVMDWLDELSLKELREVTEKLSGCSAKVDIKVNEYCPDCEKTTIFASPNLPNIFDDLLD